MRWIAPDHGQPPSVLVLPAESRVTYHLTLPAAATFVSRCHAVADASASAAGAAIECVVEVRVGERESTAACRAVTLPGSRRRRGGCALRLDLPDAGAATLVLSTRLSDGTAAPGVSARWENPRVEWRRSVRNLAGAVRQAIRGRTMPDLASAGPALSDEQVYKLWVREHEPPARVLRAQRAEAADLRRRVTLVTDLVGRDAADLRRTRASVLAQSYPHWEWLLLTPESGDRNPAGIQGDERVRVLRFGTEAGPAERLNRALRDARGELAALLDPGDTLEATALFEISKSADAVLPSAVIYSDEDRLDESGRRVAPLFKPGWSPDLLLARNYIGRLAMIGVQAALQAGGFRNGFGESLEWELLLRLSRTGARMQRIPACLYHRRGAPLTPTPAEAAAVLREHAPSLGSPLDVSVSADGARLHWTVTGSPKVSIVIPNRNAAAVLATCLDGILNQTSYTNHEVVVVDNGSTDPEVLELYARLGSGGRGRIVPFDGPFNFSAACNRGAAASSGELLLFLNNDIEVIDPGWLEELVRWAQQPGIGVVGAKLLYPDRMIQHAGVVFGLGLVGHIFARAPEGTTGVFGSSDWYRNYMAVTGACQMIPRTVFERVGGFDERMRLSFSDVVLCMEVWKAGYRVVYTPHARLVHHESYTRQKDDSAEDMRLFAAYLRDTRFVEDPYLHPELDPQSLIPRIRPPFAATPRQAIADFIGRVLAAAR